MILEVEVDLPVYLYFHDLVCTTLTMVALSCKEAGPYESIP